MHPVGLYHRHVATNTAPKIDLQHITRPPLAYFARLAQMDRCIPLCHGRHHFEVISRSMGLSSLCSVRSFFSLPFADASRPTVPCQHTSICICKASRADRVPPRYVSDLFAVIRYNRSTGSVFLNAQTLFFDTAIICSSVNCAFIRPLFCWAGFKQIWRRFRAQVNNMARIRCGARRVTARLAPPA